MAAKGDGACESVAASRFYAIRNTPAKATPRFHVSDRGRIETFCISTPAEDAPRRWEPRRCVGRRNAETPAGGDKTQALGTLRCCVSKRLR